jgi:hypothetical protein
LASALVRPARFAIVNPLAHHWGRSDWFVPYVRADVGMMPGHWVAKSSGAIYHASELTPSVPFWRSPERANVYDPAPVVVDRVGEPLRVQTLDGDPMGRPQVLDLVTD